MFYRAQLHSNYKFWHHINVYWWDMSTQLVLSFEPNGATKESLTKHVNSTHHTLAFSCSRLSVVLPKHLNLWLYHFLNYQALELRSYRQNNDKMNLRQWGEHQVLTWVHKSCWPETQAALVFSCLLSAEIVDTVIYTAMVWTRGRTAIILCLQGGLSCHCSHNLTDWPTVILFQCHSDKAQQ